MTKLTNRKVYILISIYFIMIKEINFIELSCERCGNIWLPRDSIIRPKVCPKCKSKKWNKKIEICSVCKLNKVYNKMGICSSCKKEFKRMYNLIKVQKQYQKAQYLELYRLRVDDGKLIQVLEGKFANRNKKEIFKLIGDKCFICNSSENIDLHHLKYLGLNRKNLKEYCKYLVPLCHKHHIRLHNLVNSELKKEGLYESS